ncbi:magnesium chelatase subunit D [Marimonas sp. MJW-29]|uniref:Magnesium chelatase subunit D n=1 Tax=Sulfitobacter sediminis TaxID=3234186 RepID=A0ABV3RRW0_9RHOB
MTPWGRAITALRLLEIDPDGLGGIALHARASPVRDAFTRLLPADATRLHPAMSPDTLTGGVDVAASLAEGTLVRQRGLLSAYGETFVLTMAERAPPLMAASLAAMLDRRIGNALVLLDEHAEDEAPTPLALTDRLAFHISLEGISRAEIASENAGETTSLDPRDVTVPEQVLNDLVTLAVTLGITSLRAPGLALNTARAHAALRGHMSVEDADLMAAAELVLAPRATRLPQEPPAPEETRQEQTEPAEEKHPGQLDLPQDLLLAAIQTALPADLLDKTVSNIGKNASGSGAGQKRIGNRRGRPLPARDTGGRRGEARVDLIATLRAAVPWQTLRRSEQPDRTGPVIRASDLRYRSYEDLSDRLLIFAVDASGSAALARLAETKGAVELLLAEAYARRDHVALIAFRGDRAEMLLPPTRSLVQTKRRLAELPGGGGTPLGSGLQEGLETAQHAARKGLSPVLIVLTDGRANVALDGVPDRAKAAQDATRVARQIAQAAIDTIVIDTGRRPERALRDLSASLRGRYVSLPRADAKSLSETVSSALSA